MFLSQNFFCGLLGSIYFIIRLFFATIPNFQTSKVWKYCLLKKNYHLYLIPFISRPRNNLYYNIKQTPSMNRYLHCGIKEGKTNVLKQRNKDFFVVFSILVLQTSRRHLFIIFRSLNSAMFNRSISRKIFQKKSEIYRKDISWREIQINRNCFQMLDLLPCVQEVVPHFIW